MLEVGVSTDSPAALTESEGAFRKALELVPGDTEAVAMWSLAEILQGQPEPALIRLDAALVEDPTAGNLLLIRWRALQSLGRIQEADDVSRTLQGLAPDLAPPRATGGGHGVGAGDP